MDYIYYALFCFTSVGGRRSASAAHGLVIFLFMIVTMLNFFAICAYSGLFKSLAINYLYIIATVLLIGSFLFCRFYYIKDGRYYAIVTDFGQKRQRKTTFDAFMGILFFLSPCIFILGPVVWFNLKR
jgi:hypothetical protein